METTQDVLYVLWSSVGDSFYECALKKALSDIWFPNFDNMAFSTAYQGDSLTIKTDFLAPDSSYLPKIRILKIYHFSTVPTKTIPKDMDAAIKFFHNLVFKIYMEIQTHENMELFLVNKAVYRHPHQGFMKERYEGSKPLKFASTHGRLLWRNHVMWEAVSLVARETAPDFRSRVQKSLDGITDWDIAISNKIRIAIGFRVKQAKFTFNCWKFEIRNQSGNSLYERRVSPHIILIQRMISILKRGSWA